MVSTDGGRAREGSQPVRPAGGWCGRWFPARTGRVWPDGPTVGRIARTLNCLPVGPTHVVVWGLPGPLGRAGGWLARRAGPDRAKCGQPLLAVPAGVVASRNMQSASGETVDLPTAGAGAVFDNGWRCWRSFYQQSFPPECRGGAGTPPWPPILEQLIRCTKT